METITRRSFVSGTAAAGAALSFGALAQKIQASEAGTPASTPTEGGNIPASWDYECDVLVIGAGGSGMMAAVEAAKNGSSVIVLENQDNVLSSSTTYCMGNYSACNTDEQVAAGIEDSPEKMYDDIIAWGSMEGDYPSARSTTPSSCGSSPRTARRPTASSRDGASSSPTSSTRRATPRTAPA